jgi:CRP-like cAMP-binding protein
VVRQGESGESLHLLESGHVAAKRVLPTGEVGTLLVLGPGEVFGELAVVAPGPRNSTVVTLDEVVTRSITAAAFDAVRAQHPGVDRVLVQQLTGEVRRLSGLLMEALYWPAEARIAARLAELIDVFADPGDPGSRVVIPLTQEEVAQLAGTARPTANRVLREAEAAGEVDLQRGRIVVLDRAGLLHRLGSPPA